MDKLTPLDDDALEPITGEMRNTRGRPKQLPKLNDFVKEYMDLRMESNWHHRLFYDLLDNSVVQKNGLLELNTDPERVNKNMLIMAPRFHSKSQCFTINYPLWEIYKNPNIRIIIVSANQEIAVSFNRAIMHQLENNEKLIRDWGYLKPESPKKWGERTLQVTRTTGEKDPTVTAIGIGGKLISKRADIIIIDDLIDLETARTKVQRDKALEWFENVLLPILEDGGRLVVVGTAWYKEDIYDTLYQRTGFDVRLKLKALLYFQEYFKNKREHWVPYSPHEYPQALVVEKTFGRSIISRYKLHSKVKGGVLWQDKWSFDKLMEKKENMTDASFMRQYLNEPTSETDKVFKDKDIKKATDLGARKMLVTSWDNSKPPPHPNLGYGQLITAVGVDLAISKSTRADNSAISVWGLMENRKRVLLYMDYGKWSPDETKMRVAEAYHNFNPAKIRVENVAFQDMLRQDLAEDIPVEGFHTTGGKKFNEQTGVAQIAMLMEQEKLVIPVAKVNEDHYDRVKTLLYEMTSYSYDQHTGDNLMAAWFALDALRDFDRKMRDNRGYFSSAALVDHLKSVRASHKVLLLGYNPPTYTFSRTSLVAIFREVSNPRFSDDVFIQPDEKFLIFATRDERSIAYIFERRTNEIVGKIEGNMTAMMYCNLLERAGMFFNKAKIVIDRNGEGEAVHLEMQKRFYSNLLVMQPDENGRPVMRAGYHINKANLPIAIDYFKAIADGSHVKIPDDMLIKEMGDLISVTGGELQMSFGSGQRLKTVASALWLLDNYENGDKKLYNEKGRSKLKREKKLNTPYLVFRK